MQVPWRFHLSLNVASLPRSLDFYRVLFGLEPAKSHDDYAKFDVVDPPVVFSLAPHKVGSNGPRSRIGLRLPSPERVNEIRARLEGQGVHVSAFETPNAGFGVADPDGNSWQLSVGDDAPGWTSEESPVEPAPPSGAPIVWEHYVTAPLPGRIPHEDGTVDEVRLTGSFNGPHEEGDRQRLVADAFRALKPGGKVLVHALAADKPFPREMPKLPGLAAMVSRVPPHNDVPEALRQAGFTGMQFIKFGAKAWFEHDGVEMREIKMQAWKPSSSAEESARTVIYRGPFRMVRDDQGIVYPRGADVAVPPATWTRLRQGPHAEQFIFVEPQETGQTCQVH